MILGRVVYLLFYVLTNPNFRPVWYRNFVTKKKWVYLSLHYNPPLGMSACLATKTTQFQGAMKMYRFQLWNTPYLRTSCLWKPLCYRLNSAQFPHTRGTEWLCSAGGVLDPRCACLEPKPGRLSPQPTALPTNSAIQ